MPKAVSGIPKVAIVGRPNVGKSALFNRIIKARKAIVYSEVGTTRDRVSQETVFDGKRFILTDTGGFIPDDADNILKRVKEQIKNAITESEILLFVCDGQSGPVPQDMELAALLRKSGKKIFLVVNKVDNKKMGEDIPDFYRLGLDKPYPVSALHNLGLDELLSDVAKGFPSIEIEDKTRGAGGIKVAIVGRPNVGKSSFLNCLLKEERAIVDERPGTTRDTIDTYLKDGDTEFILVDTAGLRHKRKIKEAIDVYSMARSKEAIKRSEICLVLIDAYDGLVTDDLKILELVMNEGKCCILCVNKWDLVEDPTFSTYQERVYERASFLKKYPTLFTSTKTKYNVYNSLRHIKQVVAASKTKVPTHQLNKLLSSIKLKGPFSSKRNKLKLNYGTQTAVQPPTFLIFVNDWKLVSEEHRNFIENLLRKNFGFFGAPIRLEFREEREEKR